MTGIRMSVSSLTMKQYSPVTCRRARLLFSEKPRSSRLSTTFTAGQSACSRARFSSGNR